MKKTIILLISLILLLTLSACGGQQTRIQNRLEERQNAVQGSQNQPAVTGGVEKQYNNTDQSLNNLDQSLQNSDTLNDLSIPQPDTALDQGVSSLDSGLSDLQNSLSRSDTLEDIK